MSLDGRDYRQIPASLPSIDEMIRQQRETEAALARTVGYEHERRHPPLTTRDVRRALELMFETKEEKPRKRGKRRRGRIHGRGPKVNQVINRGVRVRMH